MCLPALLGAYSLILTSIYSIVSHTGGATASSFIEITPAHTANFAFSYILYDTFLVLVRQIHKHYSFRTALLFCMLYTREEGGFAPGASSGARRSEKYEFVHVLRR